MGVDTLELDVGVTRDGVVVIHHDRRLNPDLARGPDGNWIAAPGPTIHSLTYGELQRYDVGRIRPGSEYARQFAHQKPLDGTRIPRLADLFELVKASAVRFNIETKLSPKRPTRRCRRSPSRARCSPRCARRASSGERRSSRSTSALSQSCSAKLPGIATAYLTSGKKGEAVPRMVHEAKGAIWSPDFRDLDAQALSWRASSGSRSFPGRSTSPRTSRAFWT